MSRQDDRFRKAIRLISEAAQGRKIKTFCGAVIGNSQKVFLFGARVMLYSSPTVREGVIIEPSLTVGLL